MWVRGIMKEQNEYAYLKRWANKGEQEAVGFYKKAPPAKTFIHDTSYLPQNDNSKTTTPLLSSVIGMFKNCLRTSVRALTPYNLPCLEVLSQACVRGTYKVGHNGPPLLIPLGHKINQESSHDS